MKMQFYNKDAPIIQTFLAGWMPESPTATQQSFLWAWNTEECEPLYLDCDAPELGNCFMELTRAGFTNSIKKLIQGDHFYRSDTGKCPRCYRYRPEIHWNNENLPNGCLHAEVCDRCADAVCAQMESDAGVAA